MSLEKLNVCCNRIYKAIPLAYDESLSYLEMLMGILNSLNETIEQVQSNTDWINNYSGDLSDIQRAIEIINENITTLTTNVNKNTSDIITLRNDTINAINDLNTSLRELITGNFNTLKAYVDTQDSNLQDQIDNINIGAFTIYDPTTGTYNNVQTVVNNLYQLTNKDGLTASEFDTLDLTATAFDTYQITAYEFDSQGKIILV